MGVLNLEDQLVFYRAYHYDKVNLAIHLICIPLILFSTVGILSSVQFGEFIIIPNFINESAILFLKQYCFNLGFLLISSFSIFYILLDQLIGFIFLPVFLSISFKIIELYQLYPASTVVQYSSAVFVMSWLAQFIGHGFFEHRAPALLDNLLQALVLAPFFVCFEIVFFLGFRKDLKRKMDTRSLVKMIAEISNTPISTASRGEFDRWIRLATDNKINSANSWDFALIDYFHELTVLRDGDGINFQKASATLDGCVKIYTSRIDSAATETGKLLSGLATSRINANTENLDSDGEQEDNNNIDADSTAMQVSNKAKIKQRKESSLVKSFKAIKLKKLENELIVDPLFKKALTDFDEGGAKSLFLNMLNIDKTGRIMFDTSESTSSSSSSTIINSDEDNNDSNNDNGKNFQYEYINLNNLRQYLPNFNTSDSQNFKICSVMSELRTIVFEGSNPATILEQLNKNDEDLPVQDFSAPFEFDNGFGEDGFDNENLNENLNGNISENELNKSNSFKNKSHYSLFFNDENEEDSYEGSNLTLVRLFDENFVEKTVEIDEPNQNDLDVLAYFDNLAGKNWTGATHWKVTNLKKFQNANKITSEDDPERTNNEINGSNKANDILKPVIRKKLKEKAFKIDFLSNNVTNEKNLFKQDENTLLPRTQWISETNHLLPDDQNFTTKNFIYLSLKPSRLINTSLFKTKKKVLQQRSYGENFNNDGYGDNDDDDENQPIDKNYYADKYEQRDKQLPNNSISRHSRINDIIQQDIQEIHQSFDDHYSNSIGLVNSGGPDFDINAAPDNDNFNVAENNINLNLGYGSQLITSQTKFRPNTINFARIAKRVDVKLLKENLWDAFNKIKKLKINTDNGELGGSSSFVTPDHSATSVTGDENDHLKYGVEKANINPDSKSPLRFTEVVHELSGKYSKEERSDLSTSFCFICLLHLANENGLSIESNKDNTDLIIN
ncbi:hypothetical protein PACTADRAFT_17865 [Pachysolen tannophilus NRRL Y-2460]|uniref:Condensin complex subunit 2 n=1 Tax=Pachysolen tannophilus NRRL Y-2460 TaxID=669874 RepID=A0A1E4TQV9_PACTA|nr:hypothetical protein PACTADRAFT_17865 [Pachysolen tannophilus NRRL Y-2460]